MTKPHLIVDLLGRERGLPHHHPQAKQEHDEAVARVPKHDGKQEGEGDDGEDGRVGLPVGGYSIGIDQCLEPFCEFVGPEESGWSLCCLHFVQDRGHCAPCTTGGSIANLR